MTATVVYKGDLRCECTHLQSGSVIETDAPTDNKGKGERFSPTDSVCFALATCMITTMAIKSMGKVDFRNTTLDVTKHMLADPRRIGKIEVNLNLQTSVPLNDDEKEFYQSIGDNCPVMKSIHPDIVTVVNYNWNN